MIHRPSQSPRISSSGHKRLFMLLFAFILILGPILLFSLFLLSAELFCRTCTDIHFMGNSQNLFQPKRFAYSHGNAPNIEGFSFGKKVYTDQYGFRIDPHNPDPDSHQAVLLLGDSVGFGCGVPEHHTLTGRLRHEFPTLRFYNSSVIGYMTYDYNNVIHSFVPSHPEIKQVILLYCLNDISPDSAAMIHNKISYKPRHSHPRYSIHTAPPWTLLSQHASSNPKTPQISVAGRVRQNETLQRVNAFLRSRSKFYLWLRSFVGDAQTIYENDLAHYTSTNAYFEKNIQPLREIANTLKQQNIVFTVLILPYRMQIHAEDNTARLPQTKLITYFQQHRIAHIDALPYLEAQTQSPETFYLWDDPMHLSANGHALISGILRDIIIQPR
jgi:hypothetical protein